MSFVQPNETVRLYYEEDCFDEGKVVSVDPITVDFLDWIEVWPDDTSFRLHETFYEGIEVLVPVQRGEVVIDFWPCGGSRQAELAS